MKENNISKVDGTIKMNMKGINIYSSNNVECDNKNMRYGVNQVTIDLMELEFDYNKQFDLIKTVNRIREAMNNQYNIDIDNSPTAKVAIDTVLAIKKLPILEYASNMDKYRVIKDDDDPIAVYIPVCDINRDATINSILYLEDISFNPDNYDNIIVFCSRVINPIEVFPTMIHPDCINMFDYSISKLEEGVYIIGLSIYSKDDIDRPTESRMLISNDACIKLLDNFIEDDKNDGVDPRLTVDKIKRVIMQVNCK